MKRRYFIRLVGGGAAASWSLTARGQQATSPRRVGFLLVGLSPESKEVQVFRRELRKAGYIEGRNLMMEWRSAKGDYGTRAIRLLLVALRPARHGRMRAKAA